MAKTKRSMSKLGKQILDALEEVRKGDLVAYSYECKIPDIKELRKKLGMERDQFAAAFNLSKYSVRNWELGTRQPQGPALTLLQIIQANPLETYRVLHPKH